MELAEEAATPLHPELKPYLAPNVFGGQGLFHPLVYDPFLTMPGLANKQYEAKSSRLAEAVSSGDFGTAVFLHERPHRLDAYLDMLDFIPPRHRATLLRRIWIDTENAWQSSREWVEAFETIEDPRWLMSDEEVSALAAMPSTVTVYRGAQAGLNEEGLSWTPDLSMAVWFARRWEDLREHEAVVLVGQAPKSDITAHFTSREPEFVILPYNQPEAEYLPREEWPDPTERTVDGSDD